MTYLETKHTMQTNHHFPGNELTPFDYTFNSYTLILFNFFIKSIFKINSFKGLELSTKKRCNHLVTETENKQTNKTKGAIIVTILFSC